MFSQEERCVYRNNQLLEVICQLRFPTILSISAKEPADFQDAIRDVFPRYQLRQDAVAPKLVQVPGQPPKMEPQKPIPNHQFLTADGTYRINLTQGFISLSCSKYTCWEDFARKLDKPLATFIQVYKPAYFDRVGLRYLNFVSRKELDLEGTPFAQLFLPCYLGPLAEPDVNETASSRCTVDFEMALRGGCRVKLHAGPGLVKRGNLEDKEVKFIFDQDLFMPGQVPVNLTTGVLNTLHGQADSIFRGAITDTLHRAMEPQKV